MTTSPGSGAADGRDGDVATHDPGRFRRTLLRVLGVQIVTLVALWLLQTRYTR